jgi:hypothetical protein
LFLGLTGKKPERGGGMINAIKTGFIFQLKSAGCLIFSFAFLQFGPAVNDVASDYFPGREWRTATPESQGMSSEVLTEMLDTIWKKNYSIDSITIVRNGFAGKPKSISGAPTRNPFLAGFQFFCQTRRKSKI